MKYDLKETASERIISIEESHSIENGSWEEYEGFIITTNEQIIKLAISGGQSCCENSGYFMSEDNINDFIGADLIKIEIVDTELRKFEKLPDSLDEGGVMFVNITTSKGTLQFVAYNSHNGYYGHSAIVESKTLTHTTSL